MVIGSVVQSGSMGRAKRWSRSAALGETGTFGSAVLECLGESQSHEMRNGMQDIGSGFRELQTRVSLSDVATLRGRADQPVRRDGELQIDVGALPQTLSRAQKTAAFGERQNGADRAALRFDAAGRQLCANAWSHPRCVLERGLNHRIDRTQAGGPIGLRQDPRIFLSVPSRRGNQEDSSIRRGLAIGDLRESRFVDEPESGIRTARVIFVTERISENLKRLSYFRREASWRQANVDLSADRTVRRRQGVHTCFFGAKFFSG